MAGLKIIAIVLSSASVIFFILVFITSLGQGKSYNFFVGELLMFTAVLNATYADPNAGFFSLTFILPFAGGAVFFILASIVFGKAAFARQGQSRGEGGPPYNPKR